MPVEGVNGFLDVERAALRAPQVGIANTNPEHLLSVGSNLYVSGDSSDVLTVKGNVVSEGLRLGFIEIYPSFDLEAITTVGNVTSNTIIFANVTTGLVTTANVEVGTANLFVDTTVGRVGVGTLDPEATLHVAGDAIVTGDLTVSGTTTTVDTQHLRVTDPLIELGKDNVTEIATDLGIVMTRPAGSSNVAIVYDETATSLNIGYTLGNASQAGISMESGTPLDVNIYGNVHVSSNLEVGTANLFVDTVNSRVGVGKTNPDTALDVVGTVTATALVGTNLYGTLLGSNAVSVSTLTASGTVKGTDLIGTNLYGTLLGSNAASVSSLTASGTVKGTDLIGTNLYGTLLGSNAASVSSLTASGTVKGTDLIGTNLYGTLSGSNAASVSTLTASGDVTVDSTTFHVDSTNNRVGIGTNAPASGILDVAGTLRVGNGTSGLINLGRSGTVAAYRTGLIYHDGTDLKISNQEDGDLKLATNNSNKLVIESSGNVAIDTSTFYVDAVNDRVGIGTTSPTELLDITAASGDYDAFIRLRSGSGGSPVTESGLKLTEIGEYGFQFAHNAATDLLKIRHQNSAGAVDLDDIMVWKPNGNVGIGTNTPESLLHLSAAVSLDNSDPLTLKLHNTTSDTGYDITKPWAKIEFDTDETNGPGSGRQCGIGARYEQSAGNGTALGFYTTDDVNNDTEFSTTNERMTIDHDGNVGIGTTTPNFPLTIQQTTTNTNTVTYPLALRAISSGTVDDGFGVGLRFQCERMDTDDFQTLAGSVEVYGTNIPGSGDLWNMRFGVRNNDTAVTPMTLQYDGNVGIGTTSPTDKLHVNGSLLIQHDTIYDTSSTAGWYKIGVWDPTASTGARLKMRFLGMEGYSAQTPARGGETILYASCNNNNPSTVANMSGIIHAHGPPAITEVKFVHLDGSRHKFEIRAYVKAYVKMSMSVECNQTDSFTKFFTASTDPGVDSATVGSALFSHVFDNSGNVGIGTNAPTRALDVSTTGSIAFGVNVAVANERGLYWHSGTNYGIYRTSDAWSSQPYAQLKLDWPTGIVLDAGNGAYDKSFVGVNDRMSIGSSYYTVKSPDNGLIVEGNVGIGTDAPEASLQVGNYMNVVRNITNVSSGADVVLLLTPSSDLNKMVGTIYGVDTLSNNQYRSGTVKLEVVVNTNSKAGGHAQETFSFIKHAIINSTSTYTPVTCTYNSKTWFAIRIQGDAAEDPEIARFSGFLQHNGGDDTLKLILTSAVGSVTTFTTQETVQHTEFSNQNLIVSGGNVGIGTTDPLATLDVDGNIKSRGNLYLAPGTLETNTKVGANDTFLIMNHSTYSGNLGPNHPLPECGTIMTNRSGTGTFPWLMYTGIVKDVATTNAGESLRMDFGGGSSTATNLENPTMNPLMTLRFNGNVGIGKTNPGTALDVDGVIKQTGASWSYTNTSASGVGATAGSYAYLNRVLATARNVTVTNETNTGTGGATRTRFTTTVAGRYAVSCNGFKQTGTLTTTLMLELQKNGSFNSRRAYNNIPGDFAPYATVGGHYSMIDMSANDYLEVYIANGEFHGNDSIYFSGHLIG